MALCKRSQGAIRGASVNGQASTTKGFQDLPLALHTSGRPGAVHRGGHGIGTVEDRHDERRRAITLEEESAEAVKTKQS